MIRGETKKDYRKAYMRRKRGLTTNDGSNKALSLDGSNKTVGLTRSNIEVDARQAGKLLLICRALDKDIHGLDGKVNLLSMVRYGVFGPTMESVKAQLQL